MYWKRTYSAVSGQGASPAITIPLNEMRGLIHLLKVSFSAQSGTSTFQAVIKDPAGVAVWTSASGITTGAAKLFKFPGSDTDLQEITWPLGLVVHSRKCENIVWNLVITTNTNFTGASTITCDFVGQHIV